MKKEILKEVEEKIAEKLGVNLGKLDDMLDEVKDKKTTEILKEAIYIFIGSGLGGLTRFGLGKWVNSFHTTSFPFCAAIVVFQIAGSKHLLELVTLNLWTGKVVKCSEKIKRVERWQGGW